MKTKKIKNSILLILTAFIWGVAFVAQSEGGDAVGPYTFNSVRMILGGTALLPVILLMDRLRPSLKRPQTAQQQKELFLGGISCGVLLFAGSTLQQMGLFLGTQAGKAGFLTACYILMVPLIGIFLHKKCGWNVWIGVVLALAGLYLLCIKDSFTLQLSDGLVLLCAVAFSLHILVVDHFAPKVDGVRMSCIQFFTCGIVGIVPMIFAEMGGSMESLHQWARGFASLDAWIPILYAGLFSCGIAYTLQIFGQEGLNPTVASLLMSLESVFSVLAGWLILKETLSAKELWGCVFLFVAILLAQVDFGRKIKQERLVKNGIDEVQ
ncbi:MAG: DMT family transporter [Lachnospiraceae bacterium]|nr:DMT family transporter [Lachnospiraceae bacterium]